MRAREADIYQCTKRRNKNAENGNSMPRIYMLIAVTQIPNVVVLEIIILDNMAEHQFKYPAVRSARFAYQIFLFSHFAFVTSCRPVGNAADGENSSLAVIFYLQC